MMTLQVKFVKNIGNPILNITMAALSMMIIGTHTKDNTSINNVAGSEGIHIFLEGTENTVHIMATAILIANRKGSILILQGIALLIHATNTVDRKNLFKSINDLMYFVLVGGVFAVTTSNTTNYSRCVNVFIYCLLYFVVVKKYMNKK